MDTSGDVNEVVEGGEEEGGGGNVDKVSAARAMPVSTSSTGRDIGPENDEDDDANDVEKLF
jgi:hypothetical protein